MVVGAHRDIEASKAAMAMGHAQPPRLCIRVMAVVVCERFLERDGYRLSMPENSITLPLCVVELAVRSGTAKSSTRARQTWETAPSWCVPPLRLPSVCLSVGRSVGRSVDGYRSVDRSVGRWVTRTDKGEERRPGVVAGSRDDKHVVGHCLLPSLWVSVVSVPLPPKGSFAPARSSTSSLGSRFPRSFFSAKELAKSGKLVGDSLFDSGDQLALVLFVRRPFSMIDGRL
jgi:hypothetical protein